MGRSIVRSLTNRKRVGTARDFDGSPSITSEKTC